IAAQAVPVIEAVAESFGELGALRHLGEAGFEPGFQSFDHRFGTLLTDCAPSVWWHAADIRLDVVEELDTCERLRRDRRVSADIDLVDLPPQRAPTISERPRPAWPRRRCKFIVAGIAAPLRDAADPGEQLPGVLAAAAGRIRVGHRRRIGPA